MKTQVLNVEQMQYLQELGVNINAAKMSWYATYESEPNWYNTLRERDNIFDNNCPHIPTFTLQDMLEMLPRIIYYDGDAYHFEMYKGTHYTICYGLVDDNNNLTYHVIVTKPDLLTCAYETLCWLAENNYIGGKK